LISLHVRFCTLSEKIQFFRATKLYQPTVRNTHTKTNLNYRLLDASELLMLLSVKSKVD